MGPFVFSMPEINFASMKGSVQTLCNRAPLRGLYALRLLERSHGAGFPLEVLTGSSAVPVPQWY